MTADAFDLDRLAVAHEREAAYAEMQARFFRARAEQHRQSAETLRLQLEGATR